MEGIQQQMAKASAQRAYGGGALVGGVPPAMTATEAPPRMMDVLVARAAENAARLHQLAGEMENLLVRLRGTIPQGSETAAKNPEPSGIVHAAAAALTSQDHAIQRIREAMNELAGMA